MEIKIINLIVFVLLFLHSGFTGLDQCLPPFLPVKHTPNLSADIHSCSRHPKTVGFFHCPEIQWWLSITAMALTEKPELTEFKAFVLLQSNMA